MPQYIRLSTLISFILIFFACQKALADFQPPELPLAHPYKQGIDLKEYWLSEKLDGVRAYWNGKQLISKKGNIYHAPDWFIADFPSQPLDGELWISRNSFERLMSIVRDDKPGAEWREVSYQVFDLPLQNVTFTDRIAKLKSLLSEINSPYLHLVKQTRTPNHEVLIENLDKVVKSGGEGLMLHKGDSYYLAGRSHDLLKVKSYQDAEARVIAHLPGKGKYTGMLGALLVETKNNKRFRLGTGFTDQQRREPPPIGSLVTYKHYGKTAKGLPRFASFLRTRSLHEKQSLP